MNKRIILLQKAANVSGPLRFVDIDTVRILYTVPCTTFYILLSSIPYFLLKSLSSFFTLKPFIYILRYRIRKQFYFNSKRGEEHGRVQIFDHITSVEWSSFINTNTWLNVN